MGSIASVLRSGGCKSVDVDSPVAPKGYVPVYVGLQGTESKRFVIHTSSLRGEDLLEFLKMSAEEYGFTNQGVLKIPCDPKTFEERVLAKDHSHSHSQTILTYYY